MKTVLVVDDNDSALELVKKSLEGAGYAVITRNQPAGTVAAILRDKPDVVLLDINMSSLSGDTIAKILARVSQNLDTLVLLHSSLSIDYLRQKATSTGAHGYIQKTDNATELVRRIEYWINRIRRGSSASRLEAAAPSGDFGTGGGATANVGVPSAGSASAGTLETSSPTSPLRSSTSSGRWRAAPAISSGPPHSPSSSGSMAAARVASSAGGIKAAPIVTDASPLGGAPSSRNLRAAEAASSVAGIPSSRNLLAAEPAAPSGIAATSRNMRAAKPVITRTGRQAKVLFVDDDWKMLSSYRTMVGGQLDAEFVSSSDDAFSRILSDNPPQIVVCDVVMPGLSGSDIYRRAVLLDRSWANRFVFVTGAASTPAVAEFLNTLDVRVFHKPVASDRLLDTLKQLTEGQRR